MLIRGHVGLKRGLVVGLTSRLCQVGSKAPTPKPSLFLNSQPLYAKMQQQSTTVLVQCTVLVREYRQSTRTSSRRTRTTQELYEVPVPDTAVRVLYEVKVSGQEKRKNQNKQ